MNIILCFYIILGFIYTFCVDLVKRSVLILVDEICCYVIDHFYYLFISVHAPTRVQSRKRKK